VSIEITIPRLGWSMEGGTFWGWLKKEGEPVNAGEPLFTLESEKAAQDVEAADAGILKLQVGSPKTGDVVKVGQIIGLLLAEKEGGEGKSAGSITPTITPAIQPAKPVPSGDPVESRGQSALSIPTRSRSGAVDDVSLLISPRARRRATELGVDITHLKGSGRTGRIREEDVVRSVGGIPGEKSAPTPRTSTMRRLIAQRAGTSFATIPHFYLRVEFDATALLRMREDLLPEIEASTAQRITLSDFLLRAQALALKDVPAANCIWVDDALVPLTRCDVGLVVGLTEGLMIPVVRSANEGNLAALTTQRSSLVAAAKAGKLTQDEMQGGSTSLSNLGTSVADDFTAVISPEQSSILAVGRAAPRPFAVAGKLAVRTTLRLCLSVDHRVLDGAPAAEFLGRIVERLEKPDQLV